MRTVIFANGQMNQPPKIRPDDLIIAADGGARHCRALGLMPNILIGDFDSLEPEELADFQAKAVQIIHHPRRKDFTDLELAVRYAIQQEASEILILAALGNRWDQTMANLLLPAAAGMAARRITIVDGAQEIFFIHAGETLQISGQAGEAVSLIPLTGAAGHITTTGLEYPLKEEDLDFGSTRGISNVLLEQSATVSLGEGILMALVNHTT